MRAIFLLAIPFIIFSCQAEPTQSELVSKIPFQFEDDMIFIDLKINDGPSKKFLFDTGASVTLISKELGDELGLYDGTQVGNLGATGKGSMEAFGNNKLTFKDFELHGITIMKNLKKLPKSSPLSEKFEGAIGYDILSKYIVKINYDSKELELYDFGESQIERGYEPFRIDLSYNVPQLSASILIENQQLDGDFLLDTGSQLPIIFNSPFARKNKIEEGVSKSISIEKKAGVSEVSAKFIIFKGQKLTIFNQSFHDIPSAMSTATSGALASSGFQGIVGNPVLKRFDIILNYRKQKMFIKPNKMYDAPFTASCTGISFDVKRPDKKLIAEYIVTGSPAEKAGITAGDELVIINGKPATAYNSEEFDKLFREPGNKLMIKYLRAGTQYETEIITQELI